jgi:hypothetical protein
VLSSSIATAATVNNSNSKNYDGNRPKDAEKTREEYSRQNHHAILHLPEAFADVLYRAKEMEGHCRGLQRPEDFRGFDKSYSVPFARSGNGTTEALAALPSFGIIDHVEGYVAPNGAKDGTAESKKWKCAKPNRKECMEEKFTVVFMAYNPDRLKATLDQIRTMLEREDWKGLVHECVIVWNGERALSESDIGNRTLAYADDPSTSLRIVYPLKMGLPNDLMNRYHPDVVQPTTKALLYYDDDGPFYSFDAVLAGFELWKRHSSAQVGAMSREIVVGRRQRSERSEVTSSHPDDPRRNDRLFVSHCDNAGDQVDYNFRYFANYDANMVLPSGSFLHSGYLCYLWHPVLEPLRKFVRNHPVHPDDMAVSMVVSQLSGRAPRVYSRRLKKPDKTKDDKNQNEAKSTRRRRRLLAGRSRRQPRDDSEPAEECDDCDYEEVSFRKYLQHVQVEKPLEHRSNRSRVRWVPSHSSSATQEHRIRRRLLFNIEWDTDNQKMTDSKKMWAALRTEAVNSLVRYFGSLNSGSIGWCEGTQWYNPRVDGKCGTCSLRSVRYVISTLEGTESHACCWTCGTRCCLDVQNQPWHAWAGFLG